MKYLNSFLNLFKNDYHLPIEKVYTEIDQEKQEYFLDLSTKVRATTSDIEYIGSFIKKIFRKFTCKFWNGSNDIYIGPSRDIKYLGFDKDPEKTWFVIDCFVDEWYICRVHYHNNYTTNTRIFKCDSMDGIKQLILKYKKFNDIGISMTKRMNRKDVYPYRVGGFSDAEDF